MEIRNRFLTLGTSIVVIVGLAIGSAFAADRLPFKLYDTHPHFISDDFEHFPLKASAAGMRSQLQKGTISTMENIFGLWDAYGVEGGAGTQYNMTYGSDNSYLFSVADTFPERVVPVVILDSVDPKTPDLLRSFAKAHGLAGLRMSGVSYSDEDTAWLDSSPALNTWAAANELGIAVTIMVSGKEEKPVPTGEPKSPSSSGLTHIARLAEKYPNVDIVIDHLGWPAPEGAPNYGFIPEHLALKAYKNVFFKLTTVNLHYLANAKSSSSDLLRYMVDVFGADHIMWGSDIGNSKDETFEEMVSLAIEATASLTPDEQRQVLYETGRSVFVRGGRGLKASAK